ncbi:unnamed protein product [Didymodactylos carnosus]|uniref:Uncharacterized protein n=1 Tax=Didymodactylos carnosus TaxID=1234261 RepID=A0A815PE27_9BILA|nr:unnamed protein product [Didymodactylos carnosus]CAF4321961.1 unnamed protein product [Didymodactylos carnosus]
MPVSFTVKNDICTLQLAFYDGVFDVRIKLLLRKWRHDSDLLVFAKYFEEYLGEWVNALTFWYEGAATVSD